jgi:hypothetical protein
MFPLFRDFCFGLGVGTLFTTATSVNLGHPASRPPQHLRGALLRKWSEAPQHPPPPPLQCNSRPHRCNSRPHRCNSRPHPSWSHPGRSLTWTLIRVSWSTSHWRRWSIWGAARPGWTVSSTTRTICQSGEQCLISCTFQNLILMLR